MKKRYKKAAKIVAKLLADRDTPEQLGDALASHVIEISEDTDLYIFAPDVVRRMYPLMCKRAHKKAQEEKWRDE